MCRLLQQVGKARRSANVVPKTKMPAVSHLTEAHGHCRKAITVRERNNVQEMNRASLTVIKDRVRPEFAAGHESMERTTSSASSSRNGNERKSA
ncbi:unnamed protein product [Heligmosomoides polygyrus]|uniref:Uncharacterized protein n=1 Tax=Heligmosomoides polygyrus TaxID=6339 RepID=A0A183FSF3_HELPZ|nr:unnamed protein product [Heligmosomoides polygyrus]